MGLTVAIAGISCLLMALPAGAQGTPAGYDKPLKKSIILDPFVVTPARRDGVLSEAGRSMEHIGSKRKREQQARDLPELLEETPGVFVQRTNRGAGSPIIRGLVGPQNLILIDGVRFNTSTFRTGPNQYLALIDAHATIATEVVRGPSSVLYGSGAMGGVMQILYAEPEVLRSGLSYGGLLSGRFASSDLSGGGNVRLRLSMGDFALVVGGSGDHIGSLRAGGGVEVPHSGYESGHWQAKLLYAPRADWSLQASYAGMLMRGAGRSDKFGRGELRFYDNDDHLAYLRFETEDLGFIRRLRATGSFHQLREAVHRTNCATAANGTVADRALCLEQAQEALTRRRLVDDVVDVFGGQVEALLGFMDSTLLVKTGVEFYTDAVASSKQEAKAEGDWVWKGASRGNFSDGSRYQTFGVFINAEADVLDLGDTLLRVHGGTRFSHFSAFAPDVPELGDVSYTYSGAVFSAGVQFLLVEKLTLYTSFVQGFRAPNLQETTVLGDTGSKFEIPNADLRPERSDTVELGSRFRLGPVDFSGAFFVSFLEDAIDEEAATWEGQSEIDGTPVVRRVNTAEGQSMGVEGRIGVNLWRLRLEATGTWMESELKHGDGTLTPSRRIPPAFGTMSLRYTHPTEGAYAEVSARWAGAQRELHPSDERDLRICETSYLSGVLEEDCDGTDAWIVLGVRGGLEMTERLRVDLSVSNILDARYTVHGSGFPGAGVDARITFTSKF